MHPLKLRESFLRKLGLETPIQLGGIVVKIEIAHGLPYEQTVHELVINDSFYMRPEENMKPVVRDTNMLYITLVGRDFDGIEIYLKENSPLHVHHAQLLSEDPSFTYQKIQVTINGIELGWFDYREIIKPKQH